MVEFLERIRPFLPKRKVLVGAITYALVFALTKLAIPLDPILEQLVNGIAAGVAAYLVPEEPVLHEHEAEDSPDADGRTTLGIELAEVTLAGSAEE